MRRLYLQVYRTIVGCSILVVLTGGIVWHFAASVPPFGQPFEIAGELAAGLGPPASAPREAQQQAIARLSARFGTEAALCDAAGERLASAGRPPPGPDRYTPPGLLSARPDAADSIQLPGSR